MRRLPLLSTVVAALSGGLALYLLFFQIPGLAGLRSYLLQSAASLAALALIVGIIHLLTVHLDKLIAGEERAVYSGVLVFALLLTFLLAFAFGPNFSYSYGSDATDRIEPANWLFQYVQTPIEISLMALLSISLLYAAGRLLRRRVNTFSVVFLISVVIALLGSSLVATGGFAGLSDAVATVSQWVARVPAVAGARGIILGVALGTIATGLRIIKIGRAHV